MLLSIDTFILGGCRVKRLTKGGESTPRWGTPKRRVLRRQGKSIREIARMLDVSLNTVLRYLRGNGLPRYEREARPSKLDRSSITSMSK
jgi:hypothetical protein